MTSDKDKLIVPMGRSSGSISALFILLGLSLATAITAVAVQRWEDHGFDPLEAMAIGVICTVVARHAYCGSHRLIHEKGTLAVQVSSGRIVVGDRQLELADVDRVVILSVSPYRGGCSYHSMIRDRSGHTRMLTWTNTQGTAKRLAAFFMDHGVPVERASTSWDHRLRDISWGNGLWRKATSRACETDQG